MNRIYLTDYQLRHITNAMNALGKYRAIEDIEEKVLSKFNALLVSELPAAEFDEIIRFIEDGCR